MATPAQQSYLASPTNASDEMDITTFFKKISFFVQFIPKENVLIIGRGINVQIRKDGNNEFCIHNSPNRNGEYLTHFFTREQALKNS